MYHRGLLYEALMYKVLSLIINIQISLRVQLKEFLFKFYMII